MLPPCRAVILDIDGLLLDTEPGYRRAWQQAAWALGFRLEEAWLEELSGLSIDAVEQALCQTLGAGFDLNAFRALSAKIWQAQVARDGIPVKPGYAYLLSALRQLKLPYALATNSHRPYAEKCLQIAGIDRDFPHLVTRSEVNAGKPDPDVFLAAAKKLACPPAACLAVEDSAVGLIAAHRAGMQPVWITPAASETAHPLAVAQFSSLAQLAQALQAP